MAEKYNKKLLSALESNLKNGQKIEKKKFKKRLLTPGKILILISAIIAIFGYKLFFKDKMDQILGQPNDDRAPVKNKNNTEIIFNNKVRQKLLIQFKQQKAEKNEPKKITPQILEEKLGECLADWGLTAELSGDEQRLYIKNLAEDKIIMVFYLDSNGNWNIFNDGYSSREDCPRDPQEILDNLCSDNEEAQREYEKQQKQHPIKDFINEVEKFLSEKNIDVNDWDKKLLEKSKVEYDDLNKACHNLDKLLRENDLFFQFPDFLREIQYKLKSTLHDWREAKIINNPLLPAHFLSYSNECPFIKKAEEKREKEIIKKLQDKFPQFIVEEDEFNAGLNLRFSDQSLINFAEINYSPRKPTELQITCEDDYAGSQVSDCVKLPECASLKEGITITDVDNIDPEIVSDIQNCGELIERNLSKKKAEKEEEKAKGEESAKEWRKELENILFKTISQNNDFRIMPTDTPFSYLLYHQNESEEVGRANISIIINDEIITKLILNCHIGAKGVGFEPSSLNDGEYIAQGINEFLDRCRDILRENEQE